MAVGYRRSPLRRPSRARHGARAAAVARAEATPESAAPCSAAAARALEEALPGVDGAAVARVGGDDVVALASDRRRLVRRVLELRAELGGGVDVVEAVKGAPGLLAVRPGAVAAALAVLADALPSDADAAAAAAAAPAALSLPPAQLAGNLTTLRLSFDAGPAELAALLRAEPHRLVRPRQMLGR